VNPQSLAQLLKQAAEAQWDLALRRASRGEIEFAELQRIARSSARSIRACNQQIQRDGVVL